MRKLADMVEALREVDGIEVDQSTTQEMPDIENPMEVLMGQMMGADVETKEKLIITADMVEEQEQEQPDYPDNPDPEEIEEMGEDAEEIEID